MIKTKWPLTNGVQFSKFLFDTLCSFQATTATAWGDYGGDTDLRQPGPINTCKYTKLIVTLQFNKDDWFQTCIQATRRDNCIKQMYDMF